MSLHVHLELHELHTLGWKVVRHQHGACSTTRVMLARRRVVLNHAAHVAKPVHGKPWPKATSVRVELRNASALERVVVTERRLRVHPVHESLDSTPAAVPPAEQQRRGKLRIRRLLLLAEAKVILRFERDAEQSQALVQQRLVRKPDGSTRDVSTRAA
eukprot:CAMPEP_0206130566 /NCGR_PEP_ID=MMETSP1472-20131121/41630_1 /ASSEMBLY_ACC=CAM_ASM_001108 /TAXON_ID=41880 /ORGANISM="Pycnococcus provasolii, Strain RCC251" /LENGTH=157 /DNA_ID=CAMNT_0053521929 /DNA_START=72 /DNA_END=541 /DNA_ORIENTATION=-